MKILCENCRTCKSYPNCDGCNVDTLIKALENGKFDFDEYHNVIVPDKVVHARWEYDEFSHEMICGNCWCGMTSNTEDYNYCYYCGAKMDKE